MTRPLADLAYGSKKQKIDFDPGMALKAGSCAALFAAAVGSTVLSSSGLSDAGNAHETLILSGFQPVRYEGKAKPSECDGRDIYRDKFLVRNNRNQLAQVAVCHEMLSSSSKIRIIP